MCGCDNAMCKCDCLCMQPMKKTWKASPFDQQWATNTCCGVITMLIYLCLCIGALVFPIGYGLEETATARFNDRYDPTVCTVLSTREYESTCTQEMCYRDGDMKRKCRTDVYTCWIATGMMQYEDNDSVTRTAAYSMDDERSESKAAAKNLEVGGIYKCWYDTYHFGDVKLQDEGGNPWLKPAIFCVVIAFLPCLMFCFNAHCLIAPCMCSHGLYDSTYKRFGVDPWDLEPYWNPNQEIELTIIPEKSDSTDKKAKNARGGFYSTIKIKVRSKKTRSGKAKKSSSKNQCAKARKAVRQRLEKTRIAAQNRRDGNIGKTSALNNSRRSFERSIDGKPPSYFEATNTNDFE